MLRRRVHSNKGPGASGFLAQCDHSKQGTARPYIPTVFTLYSLHWVTINCLRPPIYTPIEDHRGQEPWNRAGSTAFRSPWQNEVAGWLGSCRRDLLDHVIVLNERHLKRLMREYVRYYHEDRAHLAPGLLQLLRTYRHRAAVPGNFDARGEFCVRKITGRAAGYAILLRRVPWCCLRLLGIIDAVANRLARGNRLIAKARLWKRSYPLCSSQGRRVGATNGIPQHCADRVRECRGHAGCVRTRRRRREVRDGRERDAAKVTLDLTTRQMQVGCVSNLTPLSAEQDQLF
jgi:hypothetical protein